MRGRLVGRYVAGLSIAGAAWAGSPAPYDPGPAAPSRIEIAAPAEPGERLVVSGTVYLPDGETPAPGVVLYVYQTDHTGLYAPDRESPPRLRGWMKTDSQGRYQYATVRPAPYPGGEIPAHVHTELWGAGWPPQRGTELLFADDPRVRDEDRRDSAAAGRFAWICSPESSGAIAHCTHNLRLKATGDRFEGRGRHGLDGPPSATRGPSSG